MELGVDLGRSSRAVVKASKKAREGVSVLETVCSLDGQIEI